MARIRTIKPDFWLNLELSRVDLNAKLLLIALWSMCDNKNKVKCNIEGLRLVVFRSEKVDVSNLIIQLSKSGFVEVIKDELLIIPKDCLGSRRSDSIRDRNVKEWIKLRHMVINRDKRTCGYCGEVDPEHIQVDHIIPVFNGGSDDLSNLITSCRKCNIQKKNKTVDEFIKWKEQNGK